MASIIVDIKKVISLDLSPIVERANKEYQGYFTSKTGEHYRLLSYLSNFFENSLLLDIGTFRGASALAFAMNKKNKVLTFDKYNIPSRRFSFVDFPIEFINKSIEDIEEIYLKKSKIIFVDIAHTGKEEYDFYKLLCKIDYKGIVIFDDINLQRYGNMIEFWKSVKHKKYDLTKHCHWSGTGLIDFDKKIEFINL